MLNQFLFIFTLCAVAVAAADLIQLKTEEKKNNKSPTAANICWLFFVWNAIKNEFRSGLPSILLTH